MGPFSPSSFYTEESILTYLKVHGISYTVFHHPAVYTSAEADVYTANLPGFRAKNLFLSNNNETRHYLYICHENQRANLKQLAKIMNDSRLRFGNERNLVDFLGITAGAISLLALVNDPFNRIRVIIEDEVLQAESVQLHPLVNTATVIISREGLKEFLSVTDHSIFVVSSK